MRRQVKLPKTQYGWWRFDRYEIHDAVIRPAQGSQLSRYDPWADFQQIRTQTSGQPGYVELAHLASILRADPATKGYLTGLSPESRSKILAWCNRHGLLGVLLGRWESVTLSPQRNVGDRRLHTQVRYLKGYDTTVDEYETRGDQPPSRSCILIHGLSDLHIKEEALAETWYRFFPSVPERERETFPYPMPYSQAFWELYAEPVSEFWRGARLFAGCVEHLGPPVKLGTKEKLGSEESRRLARAQAVHTLNLLRKDVNQVLVDENDGLRQQWVSPSLLASFAEMFIQDVVTGARAQYCECCGKLFITQAYQAVYCSQPCRLRQQKRNLRDNMRRAGALYFEGRTVRQISRTLDEAPEMVQRWIAGLRRGRKVGRSGTEAARIMSCHWSR
jgi:hypothetical protein